MALMRDTADRLGRVAVFRIARGERLRPHAILLCILASSSAVSVAILVVAPVFFAIFSTVVVAAMLTLAELGVRGSSRAVSEINGTDARRKAPEAGGGDDPDSRDSHPAAAGHRTRR